VRREGRLTPGQQHALDADRLEASADFAVGAFVLTGQGFQTTETPREGPERRNRGVVVTLSRRFGGWLPIVTGVPDVKWAVADWADARLVRKDGTAEWISQSNRTEVLLGRCERDLTLKSGLYQKLRLGGRAFDRGVNVTLGLPIIRTSVDHGTAFDIAWKGVADPQSLLAAIQVAAGLATAINLLDLGIEVELVEADEIFGGRASSWLDEDGDMDQSDFGHLGRWLRDGRCRSRGCKDFTGIGDLDRSLGQRGQPEAVGVDQIQHDDVGARLGVF